MQAGEPHQEAPSCTSSWSATGLAGGAAVVLPWGSSATTSARSAYQDSPAGRTRSRAGRDQRGEEPTATRDSVCRLLYDTVKGGDFRARESKVLQRLAEISRPIIDQCVAQGVPFARE